MRLFLIYSAKKYSKSAQSSTCPPMPVCLCMRTHVCTYMYTHTCTCVRVCMHARAHTFRDKFTHELCTCRRCMQGYMYVWVSARVYTYMQAYIHVAVYYAVLCQIMQCYAMQRNVLSYNVICIFVCVCLYACPTAPVG